jgi:hypothetical protein
MNRHATTIALLALACSAGGCVMLSNDRNELGAGNQTVGLSALNPAPGMAEAEGRSVLGPDRSGWEVREFVVVNDPVGHWGAGLGAQPRYDDGTRRATGRFPTTKSCVELGGDGGSQVAELAGAFGWVPWDAISLIPRGFQSRNQISPLETDGYERAPAALELPE